LELVWALALLGVGVLAVLWVVSVIAAGIRWADNNLDLVLAAAAAVVAIAVGITLSVRRAIGASDRPASAPRKPLATSREPIPAGLRFAVLRRDGFRCAYCGRGQDDGVQLHIDHLVPVARGGRNELENLVTACATCNLGKSASDLVGA
jgi:hypothetical protein